MSAPLPSLERYRELIPDWGAFLEAVGTPLPGCVWANGLRVEPARLRAVMQADALAPQPLAWSPDAFRLPPGAAMLLGAQASANVIDLDPEQAWRYLAGESFMASPAQLGHCTGPGYVIVRLHGFALGVARLHGQGPQIQSLYPEHCSRGQNT